MTIHNCYTEHVAGKSRRVDCERKGMMRIRTIVEIYCRTKNRVIGQCTIRMHVTGTGCQQRRARLLPDSGHFGM